MRGTRLRRGCAGVGVGHCAYETGDRNRGLGIEEGRAALGVKGGKRNPSDVTYRICKCLEAARGVANELLATSLLLGCNNFPWHLLL